MKQKTDILKADISDIPAIAEIEEKYIPNGWSKKGFSDWLQNENTIIFKAVHNNKIIGFANGSWVLDEAELLNIAIEENFRKNGIAQLLFEALENHFAEHSVKKIFLEVREKNQSAISFYEKNNFKKNGMRKNYYSNPTDNGILMMKIIEIGE